MDLVTNYFYEMTLFATLFLFIGQLFSPTKNATMVYCKSFNTQLSFKNYGVLDPFLRYSDDSSGLSLKTSGDNNNKCLFNSRLITEPPEVGHGTTTLSFFFNDGIIVAVDSRASIGNFVGSKTVNKVIPISKHIIGTMAGSAADCTFWIRKLQAEARLYDLQEGREISVALVSNILSKSLYYNRELSLSIGTMIIGYDKLCGPSIYYIDNTGMRVRGDMFAVGSGSTFALGILDTEKHPNMTKNEAIALGIKAIRHATVRDAFSGGYIAVYVVNSEGWEKVFSEDIAISAKAT